MLSFTGRRNLAGDLANTSASATLTLLDTLMNEAEKKIVAMRDWPWLWKQYTEATVAGTSAYALPAYTDKPQSLYVTVGSYRYTPKEVTTRQEWDFLKQTSISSDIPTHVFYYDDQYEIFPTPSTSSNTITINARRRFRDLNVADFTTGTIDIITNGSKAVTGSATSWTTPMGKDRQLRVTHSNTAASSGDHYWYDISSIDSSTTLTLRREYGGTSLTTGAGASYIIAQCSLIPETYQILPIYDALKIYFTGVDPNPTKAQLYASLYTEGMGAMLKEHGSRTSPVIDSGEPYDFVNPNLRITL